MDNTNQLIKHKFYIDNVDPDKGDYHEFVHIWDYEKLEMKNKDLQLKLDSLKETLQYYADKSKWSTDYVEGSEMMRRVILYGDQEEINESVAISGLRAREALKQLGLGG